MNNHTYQNYSYANDQEHNLVHISKAQRGIEYFCPYCHAFMTPHMGKIRRWHFTHKANIENCCYESYLHKIAKSRIREAFLSATKFVISYDIPAICKLMETCKVNNRHQCLCRERIEHDLKNFYDNCEEEVQYKNFVADLFLSYSHNSNREPILIEVYVSHKSSLEKVTDGVRIIEIQIQNEDDIDAIVSSLRIEGDSKSDSNYIRAGKPRNVFYNFKGQVCKEPSYFNNMMPHFIYFLWMFDSGYFKADKCPCDDNPLNYIPPNAHYIICNEDFSWAWAFLEFLKRGVDVKNCLVCKYSVMTTMSMVGERICTLYKKYGTPRNPKISSAKSCSYFRRVTQVRRTEAFSLSSETADKPDIESYCVICVKKPNN